MKQFEIEFFDKAFLIVSFERSIVADVFFYEGKTYLTNNRLAAIESAKFQFSFQFTRTKEGWSKLSEVQIQSKVKEYNELVDALSNILVDGIRGFEEGLKRKEAFGLN